MAFLPRSIIRSIYPIRSQGARIGVAWATGYYYGTYSRRRMRTQRLGGNNSLICSPAFLYNLSTGGDSGSAEWL
jgi:hypothetical protein